jgi:hypothetical protein
MKPRARHIAQVTVVAAVASALVFLIMWWVSTLPAVSPASVSLAFRPWWKVSNVVVSLCVGTGFSLFCWLVAKHLERW